MDRQKLLTIFGIAWVSAALLTWFLYAKTKAPKTEATAKILAAARNLPAGTLLSQKDLKLITVVARDLPAGALTVLQHIIISHHGVPEFGAAKIPATPEAILVAQLDNLDAKTTMALAAARPERTNAFDAGGNFTEKQWALDTKLFRPDVLAT